MPQLAVTSLSFLSPRQPVCAPHSTTLVPLTVTSVKRLAVRVPKVVPRGEMPDYEDGPEIQVFVLDHTGNKWPLTMRMRQDVRILRYKVMRLSFIPQVQAAWLIHGGKEAILRHTAIDKWTGKNKTFTLEDGDTIDECLQPGQGLLNGAIIEPVLDDAEYGMSALKIDVKGAVMSLFR